MGKPGMVTQVEPVIKVVNAQDSDDEFECVDLVYDDITGPNGEVLQPFIWEIESEYDELLQFLKQQQASARATAEEGGLKKKARIDAHAASAMPVQTPVLRDLWPVLRAGCVVEKDRK